jgi:hypothetical protein
MMNPLDSSLYHHRLREPRTLASFGLEMSVAASVFVHDGDRSEYLPVEGCALSR